MTAPEPVELTDGERGVANVVPCHHYYAWVSPAGARDSARICMTCHAPDPDWLNTLAAERAAHEAQVQAGDRLREAVEALRRELAAETDPYVSAGWVCHRLALAAAAPTTPQDETGATS